MSALNETYFPSHTTVLHNGFVAVVDFDGRSRQVLAPDSEELEHLAEYLGEVELACHDCDGLGHGYQIGWRETENKGTQPIYSGPCTVFEDRGGYDDEGRF